MILYLIPLLMHDAAACLLTSSCTTVHHAAPHACLREWNPVLQKFTVSHKIKFFLEIYKIAATHKLFWRNNDFC
jgi:hypothetical protein